MYGTLGNLRANPRIGLLFLVWETGDALQISGAADLIAEFPNVAEWADLVTNRPAWKKVLSMLPRW
jgi:hypothetical protein